MNVAKYDCYTNEHQVYNIRLNQKKKKKKEIPVHSATVINILSFSLLGKTINSCGVWILLLTIFGYTDKKIYVSGRNGLPLDI